MFRPFERATLPSLFDLTLTTIEDGSSVALNSNESAQPSSSIAP
uniref:Uncharacterized protein n=1 Tax=Peronospora matthiolae TaxID=2874970 RepID=A0AAV1TAB4_9STRA